MCLVSLSCAGKARVKDRFSRCQSGRCVTSPLPRQLALHATMPHLSAEAKHAILLEYTPRSTTHSFAALARRHGVKGGGDVVRHWHDRWDRTLRSLQEKARSGRPRTLTAADVSRHIRAPILAANRSHRAIHYTDLLPEVRRKTGKQLSLRSLQQYGKETLAVKHRHTRKRTADESECARTRIGQATSMCVKLWTDSRLQCPLTCVTRLHPCAANSSVSPQIASSSSMRLLSASTPLRITHSLSPASNHSSQRQTLPPTPLATT